MGPPLAEKERVKNFKEKHGKTFTEHGRICTYVKRNFINVEKLVPELLKDALLKEKVNKIVFKVY